MSEEGRLSSKEFSDTLTAKARARSRNSGRTVPELRAEFLLQCFLSRLFAEPASPWILKGGTGLLMRVPQARHSQDLDLARLDNIEIEVAIAELRRVGGPSVRDPLVFDVKNVARMRGATEGYRMNVTVRHGVAEIGKFPIDLALGVELYGQVVAEPVEPILTMRGVEPPPPMRIYPVPDQIADKLAAMYEVHSGAASTRYRDLVDLVIIVQRLSFGAVETRAAIEAEFERRGLQFLEVPLTVPSALWPDGFGRIARDSGLKGPLRDVEVALQFVGDCLSPLLGLRLPAEWDPNGYSWR